MRLKKKKTEDWKYFSEVVVMYFLLSKVNACIYKKFEKKNLYLDNFLNVTLYLKLFA